MPSRRHFLAGLTALGSGFPLCSLARPASAGRARPRADANALPAVPVLESLQGKVKITGLKITPVSAGAHTPYVFVHILTDAGVTGLGEPHSSTNRNR